MRRKWSRGRRRVMFTSVLAAAAVLVAAGCSQPKTNGLPDPLQRKPGQVHFYGSDGNMLNGVGDLLAKDHPNAIVGMKGTTPLVARGRRRDPQGGPAAQRRPRVEGRVVRRRGL